MPVVEFEGQKFDTILVCVCRTSGYIIAIPCQNKGLTAEKTAKMLYKEWENFGVPSVVTSDNGPHLASAWWQTMCARLGIRGVYSQAYHHQANGRAEVHGKIFKKYNKKLIDEKKN